MLMSKPKSNFSKDFGRGKVGEKSVIKALEKIGIKCTENKSKGDLSYWDISLNMGSFEVLVEIKRDWMESITGNLAIEYYNPKLNKPSGLMITDADLWFIVLNKPDRIYCCPVNKLKKYCKENKPIRDIVVGGDDNASLWLYNSEIMLKDCFVDFTDADYNIYNKLVEEAFKDV